MSEYDIGEQEAYEALELPEGASEAEVKRRHRKLARQFHSDVNATADEDQLKKVNRAYETLTNAAQRKARAAEKTKTEADRRAEQARAARADRARSAAQAKSVGDHFRNGTTQPPPFGGSSGAYRSFGSGVPPTVTRPSNQPASVPSSPPVMSAYWWRGLLHEPMFQDLMIVLFLMFVTPFVLLHSYVHWYAELENYINSHKSHGLGGFAIELLGAAVIGGTLLIAPFAAFGGIGRRGWPERIQGYIAALLIGFIYIAKLASLIVWGHAQI